MDFGEDHPREHFFLGDVVETDGRPWDCCPRTFLKGALAALEQHAGLLLVSAFEQEFYYEGADERLGSAYSLDAMRRQSIFGEVFVSALHKAGVEPESYLPEYGPRQYEVTYAPAAGVTSADRAVVVRERARAAARILGHRISFSPAVTPDIVGNGVHVHMSLVDPSGRPVMYDAGAPHGLSETGGRFVAGILHHAAALCAVTAPSVISYLRLVPHRWSAAWTNAGFRDREACVRICPVLESTGTPIAPQFNIEFRAADATASPYLALGALVYAGLDGILQKMPTPSVTTTDPGLLDEQERASRGFRRLPQSLDEALDAFAADEATRAWFPPALHAAYLAAQAVRAEPDGGPGPRRTLPSLQGGLLKLPRARVRVPPKLGDHVIGGQGTAVASEQGERAFVSLRREGGAGIRHADRPVAAVGRVPDRMVDALIGEQTGHDQMLDLKIAEQIVAAGRVEEAR